MSEKPKFMTHERIMAGEEYVSYSDYLLLERERDEAREDLEFRRGLYKVQEEYLETARRERDEARDIAENLSKQGLEMMDENRSLKRERDEAREELRTAVQERHDFHWELQDAIRERNEAREEIDRYREKLDLLPISWDV